MKHDDLRAVVDTITSDIGAQIQAGKLVPGLQLPTERELATVEEDARGAWRAGIKVAKVSALSASSNRGPR